MASAMRLAAVLSGAAALGEDDVAATPAAAKSVEGYCIECQDTPHTVRCPGCGGDLLCDVCFAGLHRRGARAEHKPEPFLSPIAPPPKAAAGGGGGAAAAAAHPGGAMDEERKEDAGAAAAGGGGDGGAAAGDKDKPASLAADGSGAAAAFSADFAELAKFTPLRLTFEERRMMNLVSAALNVSNYTDRVDISGLYGASKVARIVEQLKIVFATLVGLLTAEDYEAGKALIGDSDLLAHGKFYQSAFEIARRYKMLNPDRMRDSYGKMLHLLQDARIPEVADLLGFDPVIPIRTVHTMLESRGERALALLKDPLLPVATTTITAQGRPRWEIDRAIKRKEAAIEALAEKYAFGEVKRARKRNYWYYSLWRYEEEEDEAEAAAAAGGAGAVDGAGGAAAARLTRDEIRHILYSFGDVDTFLVENRDPVDRMLELLETHFSPAGPRPLGSGPSGGVSLGIVSGVDGARLTHSHPIQFTYVRQSLVLWSTILSSFHRMWMFSEMDFLDGANRARLMDTGQGLNRVQAAPRVAGFMRRVLHAVHTTCGGWVGSSVVHLGDHNVPNSFVFCDKYTQVSRILAPIVLVIDRLDSIIAAAPSLNAYVEAEFGSVEKLKVTILADFFRHGFDGSGADNFMDAGSCIDGRLTSAWQWCSTLDKKAYSPVFRLACVLGFDGKFEK